MKHIRLTALALSGALTLSLLTACGSKPAETPDVTETPEAIESQLPETETPEVPESEEPSATPEAPADTFKPEEKPAPTAKPSEKPAETVKPSEKPAETPAPAAVSLSDLWTSISDVLEIPAASMMDLDADMLSELYGISADDLDEYAAKLPMMNVHATEFFLAKVKSGKMDAVKAGIAQRQADLVEQWKQYLPAQLELVENYKLVTNGDYIMFAIAENVDAAVTAFNNATK